MNAKGGEKIRRQIIILLTTLVFAFILCGAVSAASDNTTLNLTKGSTDNIGLDSNNVNTGPDHFLVQIHVNNTGNTTAHNVTGTFNFASNANSQYIYLDPQENATKYLGDIAPGTSADLFWLVNVNRTSSAYLKDRNYTVTVLGNNTGNSNTLTGDLIVQKLISQNRNHVTSITLSNNNPNLGDTFAVTVVSDTSSSTFNYTDLSLINYDPTKVKPLSVNITYGSNTTNSILINNPGTTNFVSVWIFQAIGAGNTPLSALILDQSGGAYHYNTDENSTTVNLNITPIADLAITKIVDNSTPLQGSTVHYTLTVTNNGPNNATGVVVNDPLPAGLSYQSSSASQGSYNSGTGIWTIGNLAVNQTVTLNITALVTSVGQIVNIANVTGNEKDPDMSNNQAIVVLNSQQPLADLGITKTVDNPTPHLEDIFTFTVTVYNNGPNTAHNVTVNDIWPIGDIALLTATPSQGTFNTGTFTWNIGTLISGAAATLTLNAEGLQFGNFTNVVNVTANETDPDPADNTANVTVNVHPHIDLAVTKTVNNPTPNVGQNVTFTVFVTNLGPQNGTGVYVYDPLPAGLTFVSSNATQGSYDLNTGIWTIGNLAVNQIVALNITATVNQTGQITNIATAFGNEHDHHPENNQGVAVVNGQPTADLNIIKTSDKTVYNNGDDVIFNFLVKNDGPNDAHNVIVSDLMPAGLNFLSVSSISQGSYNPATGIWAIGTMANGATATMEIIAKAVQTGFITNIATVNATEFDPHLADNIAAVTVQVNPSADLAITKAITPKTQFEGQNVTVTLTATNNGPDNATGVIVNDPLPAGLTYLSDDSAGAYNPITGVWNIGNLAVNQTVTLNIIAKVTGDGINGNITNIAVISGNEHDPVTANNQALATLGSVDNADLSVTKTVDILSPHVGDTITYTINLFNGGPDNTTNAKVTESLVPTNGLIFVGATATQGSYDPLTGIWDVGNFNVGELATLTLKFVVNATGNITNTVFANSSLPDLDPSDNNASTTVNGQPVADIAVNKTVNNSTPDVLNTIIYTIKVLNNGPNQATNVIVNDVLPAGLTFDHYVVTGFSGSSGTINWNPTTDTFTIDGFYFNPSGYVTVDVYAIVNTILGGQHVDNTAVKTAEDQFDNNTSNDASSVGINVNPAADIAVNKTITPGTQNYGKNATFTITVKNNGPNGATGVKISDLLPAGLTYVSDNSGGSYNHLTGVWNIGNLANGATATLNIIVNVNATGSFTNTANLLSLDQYDWNASNNQSTANLNVPAAADLEITKTADHSKVTVGHNVTFTVAVRNNGPDTAVNTWVNDLLPDGLSYVSSSANIGTYDPATGIWTIGNLPEGSLAVLTITAKATKTGEFTNTAVVHSDTFNTAPGDSSSVVVTGVNPPAPTVKAVDEEEMHKTIPLQKTGLPVGFLVAAILMVFAGLVPKRK